MTITSAGNEQMLKVVPRLTSQRYCYADAETFSVLLKLRVRYVNETDKELILDKKIGEAWYSVMISRTTDDLAAGKYEYNPNIDFFPTQNTKAPKPDSPALHFAVIKPSSLLKNRV